MNSERAHAYETIAKMALDYAEFSRKKGLDTETLRAFARELQVIAERLSHET